MISTLYGFALPTTLNPVGGVQLTVNFYVFVGDGINAPANFQVCYTWDFTQPAATNIANIKAAVVSQAAQYGFAVQSSNVNVLMAVN